MAIIRLDSQDPASAVIDTFLMSCRVIGRNVEYAFFDEIVQTLSATGITKLWGEYLATAKNSQVQQFYTALAFEVVSKTDQRGEYAISLAHYRPSGISYIEKN